MIPHITISILAWAAIAAAQSTIKASWIPFDTAPYTGNATLDDDGHVQAFWTIGNEYSTYAIASQSDGYLAMGFSQTGAMTGADIALGSRSDNGSFVFENRYTTGFVMPQASPDQATNMHYIDGGQANGVTWFSFQKKNTADCLQTQSTVEVDAWQWLIYAHSDSNTFAQHAPGNMGKQYVKLGTGETISVNVERPVLNSMNFTVSQGEVTIPTQETTYCYTLHKMPEGKKNFLIGERTPPASPLLHHLVLYSCWGLPDEYLEMIGQEANCNYQNFSNPCNGFVTEWAPGMSARTFEGQ